MARPQEFDDAPLKKSKNKTGKGKVFERDMYRSLIALHNSSGWAVRQPDIVGVDAGGRRKNMSGAVSPADFIYCGKLCNMLIECKAQQVGKALSFSRIADHQRDSLTAFNSVTPHYHFGAVAVCWYNGKVGNQRIWRSWLVPWSRWVENEIKCERKSVPMSHFEGEWARFEVTWMPGKNRRFDLDNVVNIIAMEGL